MNKKRAFTLIEISIVVLIIGILVAGITQSVSLYRKTKLAGARSVTRSSVTNGVDGLALWLDATAEEAFDSFPANKDLVSKWKDSNPQKVVKSDAIQTTISSQPSYVYGAINGLPAIKCDGVNDAISIPSGSEYFPASAPSITNNFTVFVVAQAFSTHEIDAQSNVGTGGTSGQKYILYPAHGSSQYGSTDIAGSGISLGTNGVSVYEHTGSYMPPLSVYAGTNALSAPVVITIDYNERTPTIFLNGNQVVTGLTSAKSYVFPSQQFCSSSYGAFNGYIGEIIVFDKRVPSNKRSQIEKYLGKKWGIKV